MCSTVVIIICSALHIHFPFWSPQTYTKSTLFSLTPVCHQSIHLTLVISLVANFFLTPCLSPDSKRGWTFIPLFLKVITWQTYEASELYRHRHTQPNILILPGPYFLLKILRMCALFELKVQDATHWVTGKKVLKREKSIRNK